MVITNTEANKTTNIGIVAHVDAGKTSLTERILYETHVIDEIGRVDKGNTQMDTMELERRRGITIKASVVSFSVQDLKVNLIDTPGHADFIAEVERSFSVLDGAILVISAVEGIQAQTKILMTILLKLGIPTLIFVNKIDRAGAQSDRVVESIKEKLTEHVVPLYRVENIGTKQASISENSFNSDGDPVFLEACLEQVALNDERLLEAYVNGEAVPGEQLKTALLNQVREAKIYPVFFGSAMTGVGVTELLTGVAAMFPTNNGLEDAPLSGVVFKIEKDAAGEKVAYVRIFSGSINVREYISVHRKKNANDSETYTDKIKKLYTFYEGKTVQSQKVEAGEFCKVWGLKDIKIGDVVGERSDKTNSIHFAEPQIETRIEAQQKDEGHQLYQALMELSDEDPLVKVLKDEFHNEVYIRLFGEVQKEVIETTLRENYGLAVQFSETRVVCIEKPRGIGQAVEVAGGEGNPFWATVGFRIEPGPVGQGLMYTYPSGILPHGFARTVEEMVHRTLLQGLYGWEVSDITVTLYQTTWPTGSTSTDFRNLTPLVLMQALSRAGTDVYEPINQFELSVPVKSISKTLFKLSTAKAVFDRPILHNDTFLLTGTIPVTNTEDLKRELYSFTEGEGVFLARPGGYSKMEGEFPTRKRADYNPLNRKDYLLHILRAY